MPTILLVDDDLNFLLSFVEGLRAINGEFRIYTAKNGKLAVKILKTKPVDLVVTDLRMPVMDGFELIAYMSRHNSQIPVIVITAHGTPEIENNICASAAFQFLEKPLDFDLLVERIHIGLLARASGQSKGVSLHSFLQLVEMEKKNLTLSIRSERMQGFLCIRNGKLIDAETAHKTGEKAALEIIGWDLPEIEIDQKDVNREPKISASLHSLIKKSIRGKAASSPENTADPDPDIEISYSEPNEERGTLQEEVMDSATRAGKKAAAKSTAPNNPRRQKEHAQSKPNENQASREGGGDQGKNGAGPPEDSIFPQEEPFDLAALHEEVMNSITTAGNKAGAKNTVPDGPIRSKEHAPLKAGEDKARREGKRDHEKNEAGALEGGMISHEGTIHDENKINILKERKMDVQKLQAAIENLKKNVGAGLLTTDIVTSDDGQTIAGFNSNPTASALFCQITTYMVSTLKESGFPEIGRYFIVDLTDNKMVIAMPLDAYIWIMLIDTVKSPLGMLLHFSIPKAIAAFEEAICG